MLSLVPPIITLIIAFRFKKTLPALFIGLIVGILIAAKGDLVLSLKKFAALLVEKSEIAHFASWDMFLNSWNLYIILFCVVLTTLTHLVHRSGGSYAYGRYLLKKIKTRRQAGVYTALFGTFVFFDDYFNCLTIGPVMSPVTDKFKISREKLAYIVDSTTAPICILTPFSSWVVEVVNQLRNSGVQNPYEVFIRSIGFNFYSLLALIIVYLVAIFNINIGVMKEYESNPKFEKLEENPDGKILDLVFPIGLLLASIFTLMLYTGNYWAFGGPNTLIQALQKMYAAQAIFWGGFFSLLVTVLFYLLRNTMSLGEIKNVFLGSLKKIYPILITLVLAWSLASVIRYDLKTGEYLAGILKHDLGVSFLIPGILFITTCLISYSTGTSWGTFSIMIPIIVPMAGVQVELLPLYLGATLSGSIFGDHSSPISDTTLLSSLGANCKHINHVKSQLPYALVAAGVALILFLIA